ncbi:MAG: terminase small subunit [Bacillota bacterium]|nr:terminase small subunit [Bacillota bacterium]
MNKPIGRPLKFKTVEEMSNKINHYFDSITITHKLTDTIVDEYDSEGKPVRTHEEPKLNNAGEQIEYIEYIERPSILAMCRHIGIHRDNLLEYEKKEDYHDTIKAAKSRIEEYVEQQLYRKDQVTGIIFNLKNNFGWKDKTEVETSGETTINNKVDFSNLSTEDIKELLKNK